MAHNKCLNLPVSGLCTGPICDIYTVTLKPSKHLTNFYSTVWPSTRRTASKNQLPSGERL